MAEKKGPYFRCNCKANLWNTTCNHVRLAETYENNQSLFAVRKETVNGRVYLLESKIAHGNRKQVYVVISPSNGRYVIVHRTKTKRICNVSGHDGEKCEHTALLARHFMPETHAKEDDFDSDDEICLTDILEKLKKTKDVAPIEEVLCFIFFCPVFCFLFCFVLFFCEIAWM